MMERDPSSIQRPDIIHRLQQFLGLRQWSVVPHLLEGVQAVVIMGDVREVADEKVVARPCAGTVAGNDDILGLHLTASLFNPAGSGVVVRIHEIEFNLAPCDVFLEHSALPFGNPGAFRDAPASGAIPRAQLGLDLVGPPAAGRDYVLYPGQLGRNWETGWTLFPGNTLRLDSREQSGSGILQDFSFLWTESTMRSS